MFATGDAWLSTGDLFTADADGDLWLLGRPSTLIATAEGHVAPHPVESALESVDAVDLAAVHGVRGEGARHEVVMASLTARTGVEVGSEALLTGLSALEGWQWPSVIRVVDTIPLSIHHRSQKDPLKAEGVPTDARGWWWDDAEDRYLPLDADAARALMR